MRYACNSHAAINMGKYIERVDIEDIIITKDGKDIALLTNIESKRKDAFKSLRGIIKNTDRARDDIRGERVGKYHADSN